MAWKEKDLERRFGWRRVLIPVIIGLGVAAWLLISNLNAERFEPVAEGTGTHVWADDNANGVVETDLPSDFMAQAGGNYVKLTNTEVLQEINWTWYSTFWIGMALLMMVIRDLAYMYRIRTLTDKQLSWGQSFRVIMVWEFASALTPSVVGGASVAMFIVNREGVSMGKSTALVMITALMDELFYITMAPIIVFAVGVQGLFPAGGARTFLGMELNILSVFWIAYFIILGITIVLSMAVFLGPKTFKGILVGMCRFPWLRRWKDKAARTGDEMITTSAELKTKPFAFWFKSVSATFVSWTARYWVVNFIILAFSPLTLSENFLVYARQLVMWVILLISPTPGGSGVAEIAFSEFFEGLIPVALIVILAILWRLISYYPYLFIGVLVLPGWLRKTRRKNT